MEASSAHMELSLDERDRRWLLVRDRMQREGLAATLVYGNTRTWTSFRYLANVMPTGYSQQIVLFPAAGEPLLITGFPRIAFVAKETSWLSPANVHCASDWAAAAAQHLRRLGLDRERLGVDSLSTWPARDFRVLEDLCADAELVEASRWLAEIRGPKSSEELGLMKDAVRIGELAQRAFAANLSEGKTEEEVLGRSEDVLRSNGVDFRLWLMTSTATASYPELPGKRPIRKSDPVALSSEFVRTGGYAAQVVRTYCWEEPRQGEVKRMWELAGELRERVPELLRPGTRISDVGTHVDLAVREHGFECDYLGHAMGLDMVDLPYINANNAQSIMEQSDWTVQTNEVYVFHPMIRCKGGKAPLAWVGDMYLVGESSTEWLTPYLAGLPEILSQ